MRPHETKVLEVEKNFIGEEWEKFMNPCRSGMLSLCLLTEICLKYPWMAGPYIAGGGAEGAEGAVSPAGKTKCIFSNIVSDFAGLGLFLLAILVRNLTKTEFAPADKKS